MDRGININRCSASCRTWWLELFGTSATRVSRSLALLRDRTRGPRFSINGSITQTVSLLLSARSRSIRINRLLYRGGKRRKESVIAILAKSYLIDDCNFSTDVESRLSLSPIINPRRVHNETKQHNEIGDGKVFARKFSARLCRRRATTGNEKNTMDDARRKEIIHLCIHVIFDSAPRNICTSR